MNNVLPDFVRHPDFIAETQRRIQSDHQSQNAVHTDRPHILCRNALVQHLHKKLRNQHRKRRCRKHGKNNRSHFLFIWRHIASETFQLIYVKMIFQYFIHIISVPCHIAYLPSLLREFLRIGS